MLEISKKEQVRAFIRNNPGKTSREISNTLDIKTGYVETLMSMDTTVVKERVINASGRRVNAYHYVSMTQRLGEILKEPSTPPAPEVKEEVLEEIAEETPVLSWASEVEKMAEDLATTLTSTIVSLVVPKISKMLVSEIIGQVKLQLPEAMKELTLPKISTKEAEKASTGKSKEVPKVLVMGLLPTQMNLVKAEFGELLDLRFWMDKNITHLKDMAKAADKVVAYLPHTSHKHTQAVEYVGKKVEVCRQGHETIREKLTEIFSES